MTRNEIMDKLTDIVVEQFGVTRSQVVAEARLVEDLGLDSLDVTELEMCVEDEFCVLLEPEERRANRIETVGQIVDAVERLSK